MATRKSRGIPGPLENARQRFDRWRTTRTPGSRIPERLWSTAVKLAHGYGINRVASVLQVDYYSLKKRVEEYEAASSHAATAHQDPSSAVFVELPPIRTVTAECVLELEKACGAKMRIHLKAAGIPDLAALSRSFWGAEP